LWHAPHCNPCAGGESAAVRQTSAADRPATDAQWCAGPGKIRRVCHSIKTFRSERDAPAFGISDCMRTASHLPNNTSTSRAVTMNIVGAPPNPSFPAAPTML
jgi:hypothetical protein